MTPEATIVGLMVTMLYMMMWSLLYKDNPFYRFVQHMYMGAWTGIYFVAGVTTVWNSGVQPGLAGDYALLFAAALGSLLIIRLFVRKAAWFGRLPVLVIVGVGYGVSLMSMIKAQIVDQLIASFVPLTTLDNIIIVSAVIAVTFYFFFSAEQRKGLPGYISKYARYVLMVAFGANFAYGFVARITAIIGPMRDYVLVSPNIYIVPIVLAIILVDWTRKGWSKKESKAQ